MSAPSHSTPVRQCAYRGARCTHSPIHPVRHGALGVACLPMSAPRRTGTAFKTAVAGDLPDDAAQMLRRLADVLDNGR